MRDSSHPWAVGDTFKLLPYKEKRALSISPLVWKEWFYKQLVFEVIAVEKKEGRVAYIRACNKFYFRPSAIRRIDSVTQRSAVLRIEPKERK